MWDVRADLPTGTVTFLFTDIEGSTRLLHQLGPEKYAEALLEHRRLVRAAFTAYDGVEVDTQGDAFFVAFPTAPGAVRAAGRIAEDLSSGPIRLRMGVHTGTPYVTDEGYVGDDVHRAARIAACGHGGQVLVSSATAALLTQDGLPAALALRDLGDHRLKDLSSAERIYQLGADDFAPLKSLHRTNLPVPATPFVGRVIELSEVTALLARGDVRLLTLTGPGGTGKTRLALQAAAEVADNHPGGVYWVPLATVRDPGMVLEAVARTVGATDDLAAHIGNRSMLVLLDNVEQVIDSASDLTGLLAECPALVLVVTSRETLRVAGEQVYPVPTLHADEAVELFVARARAASPHFSPTPAVRSLCERLDQLPLAVELAAARVRMLAPEVLLDKLARRLDLLAAGRGADPRQQTLRATIEWSDDLLDEGERRLFTRLGVFVGGCSLESAEEVCGAELEGLESLVDKSLLRVRDDGRFSMLETIRDFAVERLAGSGEVTSLCQRHADHFLAVAEEAGPHLRGSAAGEWLDRLGLEHDNMLAALDHYQDSGDRDAALRLAAALSEFWQYRGYQAEGRRRLARALEAGTADESLRSRALDGAAVLAASSGDLEAARGYATEALAIHAALGEEAGQAESLWTLGYVAIEDQDLAAAQTHLEESLGLFRDLGSEEDVLGVTRTLAFLHTIRGDLDSSRALHEENLANARRLGNSLMKAESLGSLSMLAISQGRHDDALAMLSENDGLYRQLGDRAGSVTNLGRLARLLAVLGELEWSATLLACSDAHRERLGGLPAWLDRTNDETRAMQADLPEDVRAEATRRGARLDPGDAAQEALAVAVGALGHEQRDHSQ